MRKFTLAVVFSIACLFTACNKSVNAPLPPGAIDTTDAYANRVVLDSSAAIHSVKIWYQCSADSFPATEVVDGKTENCDPSAGTFPAQGKAPLNKAISTLNIAGAAGQAYHAGASKDAASLGAALTSLTQAVQQLLSTVGGK